MKLGVVQQNLNTVPSRAANVPAQAAEPAPQPPTEQYTASSNHSYNMFVLKRGVASAAMGAVPFYGAFKFGASAFTSGIMGSSGTTPAILGAVVNLGSSVALCCGQYQAGLAGLAVSAALGPAAKLSYL